MKKKLQIFVSSTYKDLLNERQSAVEAILRAGHIPAGMELFSAGNKSQLETIKKWIEESDAYMLILGGRYGSLEPIEKISYTELEYQYAVELDKPLFAIIIDDPMLDIKLKIGGRDVIEMEHQDEYKKFKNMVLSKVCRFVNSETEIKLAILESIIDIQSVHSFSGWIRGDEIPDNSAFLSEINILRNQRDELQKKVIDLESLNKKVNKVNDSIGDFSYNEVYNALITKKIKVPITLNNGVDLETSSFHLLINFRSQLTTGVSITMMGDIYKFIIQKVVPILLNFNLVERINIKSKDFQYDKFIISSLGNKFLSIAELKRADKEKKKESKKE